MKATLEPGYSFFYAPESLKVQHVLDVSGAIAAVDSYAASPLNSAQREAIEKSLATRVSLLWGPPGTGKTWTLAALIASWTEAASKNNKPISILVGAANYNAIDNVLLQLSQLLARRSAGAQMIDLVRVRSESSEALGAKGITDLTKNEATNYSQNWATPTRTVVVGGTFQQLIKLSQDYNGDKTVGASFFDLLVLDEASQVSTAAGMAYACLAKSAAHLVVCGDHRQLGPIQHIKLDNTREGLLESTFAFLQTHHKIDPVSLSQNYRSNEAITGWPRQRFYPEGFVAVNSKRRLQLGDAPTAVPQAWPSSLTWSAELEKVLSPDEPVCVLSYSDRGSTVSNYFEASVAASLIQAYWLRLKARSPALTIEDFWADKAGLVTPHRAQIATIRNLLGKDLMPSVSGMSFVDTVDRFQGQERDLIVASYTVSDPDFIANEEAFILDPRRFNVTLTRARCKFILLVSQSLLSHLPGDLQVANDAAHMQLFTQNYCEQQAPIFIGYNAGAGLPTYKNCEKFTRTFNKDA